jgi:hypothetical protein
VDSEQTENLQIAKPFGQGERSTIVIEEPTGRRAICLSFFTFAILAFISLSPGASFGQTTETWDANGQANWADANFWSNHLVPDAGTNVVIAEPNAVLDSNGCVIDNSTTTMRALDLQLVGTKVGATRTLSVLGGSLDANNIYINGQYNAPTLYQSGGTVVVRKDLIIGSLDPCSTSVGGTYTLNEGNLFVGGNEILSQNAFGNTGYSGFFYQADGNNYVKGDFVIGYPSYAEGLYGAFTIYMEVSSVLTGTCPLVEPGTPMVQKATCY